MLSIIAAVAKNNVIGNKNNLIWNLPEDLKRFKRITSGHTIIMGRKTFESLGRILPDRKHVIITNNINYSIDNQNVEVINNLDFLEKYIKSEEESFVIGGASIYKELMPLVNKMYITKINEEFEGDAYFPQIDFNQWSLVEKVKGITNQKNPYDYEYITYIRK